MSHATLETRLRTKTRREPSGCWVWLGLLTRDGYGRTTVSGRDVPMHVATYEHFVGPVPDGLVLDHLCRNRACCNPAHLEPVTHLENVRRGTAGPRPAGATCPRGHVVHAGGKCRVCRAARQRESYERKRARVSASAHLSGGVR